MRPGFDPTRRNRNIGTAKQGHGADNELRIPERWSDDRVFYERLDKSAIVVRRKVLWRELTFFVEPPRPGSHYPCTIDDVVKVLECLPPKDTEKLDYFVFRQPTRKQEIMAPVWGRMVYWACLGRFEGVAIYLEAAPVASSQRWPLSQSLLGMREVEELREDGHRVRHTRRHFEIESGPEACRTTQLFRTVPHEIGHLVHYRDALDRGIDHWQRSTLEKEQFANAYAASFLEANRKSRAIPFDPLKNDRRLHQDGLNPRWFAASAGQ